MSQRNIIVSTGCGQLKPYDIPAKSFIGRLWRVFNNKIDAERQHNDFVSAAYDQTGRLYRLNPILDIEEVSLNDIKSIPALQEAIASVLKLDVMFLRYVQDTSRALIASLFYVDMGHRSSAKATVVISSRLNHLQLQKFREKYPCASFSVASKVYVFKIPRLIALPSRRADKSFEVELQIEDWSHPINGSPFTIGALSRAQRDYPLALRQGIPKVDKVVPRKRKRD